MLYIDPNDPLKQQKIMAALSRGQPYTVASPQMSPVQQTGGMQSPFAQAMQQQSAGVQPGMSPDFSQSSDRQLAAYENQDFSGREKQLSNQAQMARAMLAQKAPESTIRAGNVVAPNIWGGLQSGIEKLAGGYMLGKTREAQAELEAERALRGEAIGEREVRDAEAEEARLLREAEDKERVRKEEAEADLLESRDAKVFVDEQGANPIRGYYESGMAYQEDGTPMPNGYTPRDVRAKDGQDGGFGRIYGTKRYVDQEGNEYWLGQDASGRFVDTDKQQYLSPEFLSENGIRQEDPMNQNQLNRQITEYVKSDKAMRELENDMTEAERVWKENGWDGESNIFNWATKLGGLPGQAARAIADVDEEGSPAATNYAQAMTVMNAISRNRAGLSQTVNEIQRIREETGLNPLTDPAVFMQFWDSLKTKIEADRNVLEESMSPTARKELNRRKEMLREEKGDGIPMITTQAQYDALPSGARYREEEGGEVFVKP